MAGGNDILAVPTTDPIMAGSAGTSPPRQPDHPQARGIICWWEEPREAEQPELLSFHILLASSSRIQ